MKGVLPFVAFFLSNKKFVAHCICSALPEPASLSSVLKILLIIANIWGSPRAIGKTGPAEQEQQGDSHKEFLLLILF